MKEPVYLPSLTILVPELGVDSRVDLEKIKKIHELEEGKRGESIEVTK